VTELERGSGRRGVVSVFDESVGLGTIVGDDRVEYSFHCIEIADGTRTIEPGTDVSFDLLAKLGHWEASNIRR
jgi:CspA family cold shock protein